MFAAAPYLVQLSDPHIGAGWGGGDPEATLADVVAAVCAVAPAPDAVVVSGDLADHAQDAEYRRLAELLAPLPAPIHVLAGNHDDREAIRRHFGVPGTGAEPVQYSIELGALRVVALDSTDPGRPGGRLDDERLAWLDAELALAPDTATVVAVHHPPLRSGLPWADAIGLPLADSSAFAVVLARHAQVRRVIAGHVHRSLLAALDGCAVLAAPSTYAQAKLGLDSDVLAFGAEPPGFAVHALVEGELVSHVCSLAD